MAMSLRGLYSVFVPHGTTDIVYTPEVTKAATLPVAALAILTETILYDAGIPVVDSYTVVLASKPPPDVAETVCKLHGINSQDLRALLMSATWFPTVEEWVPQAASAVISATASGAGFRIHPKMLTTEAIKISDEEINRDLATDLVAYVKACAALNGVTT